jgi:hypothetical protein
MRALALIAALVASSGCATVLNENSRIVTVQSNLPGAMVVLDGRAIGPAPRTVQVTNSHDHTIVVHAPGHAPETCFLDATVGVGWVVLDVILIPLILPIVIDLVTGEWRDLESTDCYVTLVPLPQGAPPTPPPPP